MVGILRLGNDELPTDELEGLALEHAKLHEQVVLDPPPAPERQRGMHHGGRLAGQARESNVRVGGHSVAAQHALTHTPARLR
jgi:hypothetical protein